MFDKLIKGIATVIPVEEQPKKKRRPMSEATKRKIAKSVSKSMTGRVKSEETKRKIGLSVSKAARVRNRKAQTA